MLLLLTEFTSEESERWAFPKLYLNRVLEAGNLDQEFIISEVFKNSCPFKIQCKGEKLSWGGENSAPERASSSRSRGEEQRGAVPPAAQRFPNARRALPPRARCGEGAPRRAAPAGARGEGSVHSSLKCKILVAAVWGEESASPLTCAAAL